MATRPQVIAQIATTLDEHATLSAGMFLHFADHRAVNRALADTLVQIVQMLGDWLACRSDKEDA